MSTGCPSVALGEVLRQDTQYVHALEPRQYPKLSVKLYGRGVVLDSSADGRAVKMQKHQFARPGQVILSEIWAKKGAIGIVPPEGNGALCTSHFFLFDIDETKAIPAFVAWLLRGNYFEPQLNVEARGTTGYAAIRPKQFLATSIPLPPLDEQRRIVARIDELAVKIIEARALRLSASGEAEALARSATDRIYQQLKKEIGLARLDAACTSITDGDHLTPQFSEGGVKFIFVGNVSTGQLHFNNVKYVTPQYFRKLSASRVPRRDDLLYSAVGATLGIPAVVSVDDEFCFQRHVAIMKPDRSKVVPRFLWHMLRSKTVFDKAWASTTGSAQPTIPLRAIRELPIPLPSLNKQTRVVAELDAMQARVEAVRSFQTETTRQLDAMLPAILDKAFKGEL